MRNPNSPVSRQPAPRAYGEHFADRFYLEKPKSHVTRSLKRGVLAVTQIKSDLPTPQPSQSIGYDEAYLVGLMVGDVPNHELWQDGRAVRTESFKSGVTALFDLRRDPINYTRTAHHSVHFYLPRVVLSDFAQQQGLRFDGELRYKFASGYDDPVIRQIGAALLPALERDEGIEGLFLDHLLSAVAAHVVQRYGETGEARPFAIGGLARWQERRAKELMSSCASSDLSLRALADECGLSVPHFTRAFRQSVGTSPHRWIVERRIEKAMAMLEGGERSLSEIAIECGFADQSHFTRVFTKQVGLSPGHWRRQRATGPIPDVGG